MNVCSAQNTLYVQLLTLFKKKQPRNCVKDNHGVCYEKKLLAQCKYVAGNWLFLIHAICALNLMLEYFCHLNPDCS